MYSYDVDYTGVLVNSSEVIAVYGGCDCLNVPDYTSYCDHVMEQVTYRSNITG